MSAQTSVKPSTKRKSLAATFPAKTTWIDAVTPKPYPLPESTEAYTLAKHVQIPDEVWCLLWTIDEDGNQAVGIGKHSAILGVWVSPDSGAIEEDRVVVKYSPIFSPSGHVWAP